MGNHAKLSPSAASRWLNCTASVALEATQPDKGSEYAREGTLAHAMAARRLCVHAGYDTKAHEREIEELRAYRTADMPQHVDVYVSYVLERMAAARAATPDACLLVEERLKVEAVSDDCFGTVDALIARDGCIEVVDLKYGKGVEVSARRNPQMMIYALGALDRYGFEYDVQRVTMTIVQPRLDNISADEISVEDLRRWATETLAPKAAEALSEHTVQRSGEWCRFCKVRGRCRKLAADADHDMYNVPDPRLLSSGEIGFYLWRAATIKAWVSAVEEHAMSMAMHGTPISGYKLVAGRSSRRIKDEGAAIAALEAAGIERTAFMAPESLLGITALESNIGRKRVGELIGTFVDKPRGKPTLVPETDARPPINAATLDFENID